MMKIKINKSLMNKYLLSTTLFLSIFFVANYGLSDTAKAIGGYGMVVSKCPAGSTDVGGICMPGNSGLSGSSIYTIIANLFSWLMGIFTTFSIIAFVVSGVKYFMSSGDESMAESAKENAKYAVVGIVIGLSGFIIIKAISGALSGQSYFF